MAQTVVGLFDRFDDAQDVVQDLMDAGFQRDNISVVANESARGASTRAVGDVDSDSAAPEGAATGAVGGTVLGGALGLLVGAGLLAIPGIGPVLAAGPLAAAIGTTAATVGAGALGAGIGAATGGLVGGLVGAGVPKEQAEFYAEGVRRGGTLVSVQTDGMMTQRALDIMQRRGAIDIDQRGAEYRSSGWSGFDANAEPYRAGTSTDVRTETSTRSTIGGTGVTSRTDSNITSRSGDVGEQVIPVVEEDIDISKRTVERGGVRVSTHVEERPVEENVNLREERVHVERRPVDRAVTDADAANAFTEGTIEMRETSEEAVVRKRARVVEEVIIDKDVSDRTETIRDTVRRTDVDVDQLQGSGTIDRGTTTTGSTGYGVDYYDNDFRSHYQQTYGHGQYSYEDYQPVYSYGHSLASDSRFRDRDWDEIEPEARRHWEQHNPNTWEQFKDTVRYSWDKVRGKR
jgi:uncharacterized protein (TIGR02271 family)